jgi:hypothetical protein
MRMDPERLIGNYTRKVFSTFATCDIPEAEAGLYGLCFLLVQQSDPDRWLALRRAEKTGSPGAARIFREAVDSLNLPVECAVRKGACLKSSDGEGEMAADEAVCKLTALFDDISVNGDDIRMGVSDRLAEAAHRGYSTPLPVADLVVELASPSTRMAVYDPACCTGSMLVRCARHVARNDRWPDIRLYGTVRSEKDDCITRLNLKINGLESDGIAKILKPEGPGPVTAGRRWADIVLLDLVENPGETRFEGGGYPLDDPESFLAPGSLLALLMPGKVLAGEDHMNFRKWLVESDALEAIVRLPNGLFPKIRADIDLLLIRREKPAETKGHVLFADASALPMDRGRKALPGQQAEKVVDLYSAFHRWGAVAGSGGSGLHHLIVPTLEIERVKSGSRRRGYDLDVSHYVVPEPEPVDLEEEVARLVGYERRREVLGREMEEQMGRVLERMRDRGGE